MFVGGLIVREFRVVVLQSDTLTKSFFLGWFYICLAAVFGDYWIVSASWVLGLLYGEKYG